MKTLSQTLEESLGDTLKETLEELLNTTIEVAKEENVPVRILHSHQNKAADQFSHVVRNIPLIKMGLKDDVLTKVRLKI